MRGRNGSFLNVLMMLAFIAAGISPACKFISGQMTWMEICGAMGTKMVAVPADQIPQDDHSNHQMKERCAFCFTSAHLKSFAATPVLVAAPVVTAVSAKTDESVSAVYTSSYRSSFPRGPPAAV